MIPKVSDSSISRTRLGPGKRWDPRIKLGPRIRLCSRVRSGPEIRWSRSLGHIHIDIERQREREIYIYASVCNLMHLYASLTHLYTPIRLPSPSLRVRTPIFNTHFPGEYKPTKKTHKIVIAVRSFNSVRI